MAVRVVVLHVFALVVASAADGHVEADQSQAAPAFRIDASGGTSLLVTKPMHGRIMRKETRAELLADVSAEGQGTDEGVADGTQPSGEMDEAETVPGDSSQHPFAVKAGDDENDADGESLESSDQADQNDLAGTSDGASGNDDSADTDASGGDTSDKNGIGGTGGSSDAFGGDDAMTLAEKSATMDCSLTSQACVHVVAGGIAPCAGTFLADDNPDATPSNVAAGDRAVIAGTYCPEADSLVELGSNFVEIPPSQLVAESAATSRPALAPLAPAALAEDDHDDTSESADDDEEDRRILVAMTHKHRQ